ncbi:aromatic prenyltransferase [Zopfia rhizophila CBS 207.26]|uniref:Aromatic prenyltransferase n=1 Tax=Zopfia rhizophila CBS 207.26 TaxID=1314779 RepID=A0A6A6DEZ4_9PEZI|nr:aromatic prenyltransferase [Zopfia rhizophila CBS 207.26]
MNAFWRLGTQHLLSIWHYSRGFLSTLLLGTPYHVVPETYQYISNLHQTFWCRTTGHVLDVLMQAANYSHQAHGDIMSFFAENIAPFLGPTDKPNFKRWKSFMTDDNTPIEISWDWCGPADEPIIRFSIDPMSLSAGTFADPMNATGPESFKNMIFEVFPKIDMFWFDHFNSFFNRGTTEAGAEEDHPSRIFWGFDLGETGVTTKTYFFPGPLARTMGASNLCTIAQSLACAPYCTPDKLQAFNQLASFANSLGTDALEFEMLAIDMVDPLKSRLKLYFRNRRTDFSSIRDMITLNGEKPGAHLEKGLCSLKKLWDSLFDRSDAPEDLELRLNERRTAGILYNAEFRLGSSYPDVKIYIPVRHYSRNDQHVMDKVQEFVDSQRQAAHVPVGGASGVAGSTYVRAMKSIL